MPELEIFAVHRLIAGSPATGQYIGAARPDALEPPARARVEAYVTSMVERDEGQGRAQAAWWLETRPEHLTRMLTSHVKEFNAATCASLDALVLAAKGKRAQSGVMLFVRSRDGNERSLVCLKMALEDAQLALFEEGAASADRAIHVEDIANKLPEATNLKKGALIPNPWAGADLRVLDEQLEDPADYWLEWLGARARPKEPDTMKLIVTTTAAVLRDRAVTEPLAAKALAETLQDTIDDGKPITPKQFVRKAAEKAGVPADEAWTDASTRRKELAAPEAAAGPDAAALQKTIITLGPGITVSGLSIYLDRRYDWHAAPPGQEGYVLEITSDVEPNVKRTKATGRR